MFKTYSSKLKFLIYCLEDILYAVSGPSQHDPSGFTISAKDGKVLNKWNTKKVCIKFYMRKELSRGAPKNFAKFSGKLNATG